MEDVIRLIALAVMLLPLVAPAQAGARARMADFPLRKGTIWRYQGKVRWTVGNKAHSGRVRHSMRVVDVVRRGSQTIALVRGSFYEMAWYEPGAQPELSLFVREPSMGLFELNPKLWEQVQADPKGSIPVIELRDQRPLLPADLEKYHVVERSGVRALDRVQGWAGPRRARTYRVSHQYLPDHDVLDFVPGLGITRFVYVHHGTVAECDLRLVAVEPELSGAAGE